MKKRDGTQQFALENFEILLDFLYKQNPNQPVRLLGGEPTLHTNLDAMLQSIVRKGFNKILFFSNGIISPQTKEIIKRYAAYVRFVWNVNPPDLYPAQLNELIERNIRELSFNNSCVGINMYKTDYDPTFVFKLIQRVPHISSVRIGIAHPMGNFSSNIRQPSISIREYPKVGSIVYAFVKMAKETYPQISSIDLDCGFTPCLFNPSSLEYLVNTGIFKYMLAGCSAMTTDISSDLTVRSCFAVSGNSEPNSLKQFGNATDIMNYNLSRVLFARKYLPPADARCVTCPDRYSCSGGCSGERILQANSSIQEMKRMLAEKHHADIKRANMFFTMTTLYAASYNNHQAAACMRQLTKIISKLEKAHRSDGLHGAITQLKQKLIAFRGEYAQLLKHTTYHSVDSPEFQRFVDAKFDYMNCCCEKHLMPYLRMFAELFMGEKKGELHKSDAHNRMKKLEIYQVLEALRNRQYSIKDPDNVLFYAHMLTQLQGKRSTRAFLSEYLKVHPAFSKLYALSQHTHQKITDRPRKTSTAGIGTDDEGEHGYMP